MLERNLPWLIVSLMVCGCHGLQAARERIVSRPSAERIDDEGRSSISAWARAGVTSSRTATRPVSVDPDEDITLLNEIAPSESEFDVSQASLDEPPASVPKELPSLPDGAPSPGATGELTLEQLESMARDGNPAIAEATARAQALRGKYVQVGLCPNPTVGYVAAEIGNQGKAGQQGVFVGQEIVTGGKLRLNRNVAAWEVQRADQLVAATELRVLTDVRMGYYETFIAQRRLQVTSQLQKTGQKLMEAVETLRAARESSEIDLLQAKVEADNAKILVENARTSLRGAWQRLATVVGDPEIPLQRLADDPSRPISDLGFDESLDRLLSQNPQLAAAYTEIERAQAAVAVAWAPRISLSPACKLAFQYRFGIAIRVVSNKRSRMLSRREWPPRGSNST